MDYCFTLLTKNLRFTMNKDIYIGYDCAANEVWHVCQDSIIQNSFNQNLKIHQLSLSKAKKIGFNRKREYNQSTEFSFTRFLTPALNDYKGWAIFMDVDMILVDDIDEIFDYADDEYAVMVVKHNHIPKTAIKMDNRIQSAYPRKNWSSVVLYNCGHPANKALTVEAVNTQPGSWLHQFKWLKDEEIGELPIEWNWLVGYQKEPEDGTPKLIHYTDGGPWLPNYVDVEYADEYFKAQEKWEYKTNTHTKSIWGLLKRMFYADFKYGGDLSYCRGDVNKKDLEFMTPIYDHIFKRNNDFFKGDGERNEDFVKNVVQSYTSNNNQMYEDMQSMMHDFTSKDSHVAVSLINNEVEGTKFHRKHIEDIKRLRFQNYNHDVIEVGRSRNFLSPQQVICEVDIIKNSTLYFGSQCSWWHISRVFDKPSIRIWPDWPVK